MNQVSIEEELSALTDDTVSIKDLQHITHSPCRLVIVSVGVELTLAFLSAQAPRHGRSFEKPRLEGFSTRLSEPLRARLNMLHAIEN